MKKIKLKSLFVFALIVLCAFSCITIVGCKNENQTSTSPTYTVSFYDYDRSPIGVKLNEDDETLVYVQNVKKGESAIAPISPTRSGYEFKGWNKDFSNVNSNLEIMAEYVQVCEVVFWNDNEIHEVQIVEYGNNAQLPLVDPAKTGYRFDHWDGKYINVIANTSVYAVFVKQYTVTFLGFEGAEIDVQLVDENDSALTPNIPEVEGYVFDHWDKDYSNVTSDLTVNAVYRELNSFNVSFVDNDGSVLKQERVYKGTSATAPDMTNKVYIDFDSQQKQGYVFDHWNMDFSNVNADLVVEAQYIQIDKPILFVKPEVVKKGTTNYVTVSVYVVSNTAFSGLNININYSNALELTEDNISVKSIFGTQNRYDLELDAISHEINFSWYYPAEGGYSLTDNYSKVMELKFEIDDYISVGEYAVEILSSSYYVKDNLIGLPVIISGYVKVEEVH